MKCIYFSTRRCFYQNVWHKMATSMGPGCFQRWNEKGRSFLARKHTFHCCQIYVLWDQTNYFCTILVKTYFLGPYDLGACIWPGFTIMLNSHSPPARKLPIEYKNSKYSIDRLCIIPITLRYIQSRVTLCWSMCPTRNVSTCRISDWTVLTHYLRGSTLRETQRSHAHDEHHFPEPQYLPNSCFVFIPQVPAISRVFCVTLVFGIMIILLRYDNDS